MEKGIYVIITILFSTWPIIEVIRSNQSGLKKTLWIAALLQLSIIFVPIYYFFGGDKKLFSKEDSIFKKIFKWFSTLLFVLLSSFFLLFVTMSDWEKADVYYDMEDFPRALTHFTNSCNKNEFYSCYSTGYMHYYGQGTEIDFEKAKFYLKKACFDGSNQDACDMLNNIDSN